MQRNRGFGLIETLISATVVAIVLTGAAQLTIGVGRSFGRTTTQLNVDQSASRAVQWLNQDLEEAKQVVILSPTWLRVYYPLKTGGIYNRLITDNTNPVDYYRGNTNLTANPSGTALIRSPANGTARVICRGVTLVQFTSLSTSSVDITLNTAGSAQGWNAQCNMVHRAIFLRNN
jgi:prepilin-type N-terminal cleavage/methylation domain-containing protein